MAKLVKIGVPYAIAWDMHPTMQLAWLVADGENAGGTFDWGKLAWQGNK